MEFRGKDIICKEQQWAVVHTPGLWYPCIKLKCKAKQVSNCRSINCKSQPGAWAASFIKNGLLRTPQNGIPKSSCSSQTTHHTEQCTFASPVVQRAQTMDYRAVENCDMVRWIILHHVLDRQVHMWCQPKEFYNPECLILTVKGSGGSIMLWGTFTLHDLDAVIPWEGKVNANRYLMGLSDHLHPVLQHFIPAGMGIFRDGKAPSTEHVWSPNRLMRMTMMLSICHHFLSHQIWTQSSIYGIFWNDASDSIDHLDQTGLSWWTFLWKNDATSLLQNSRHWWTLCHGAFRPY